MTRDAFGRPLIPGLNADRVDVAAGLRKLSDLGWAQEQEPNAHMEVEYNLQRWARGEEADADHSMSRSLSGVDYTSWRVVLAAAIAAGEATAGPPASDQESCGPVDSVADELAEYDVEVAERAIHMAAQMYPTMTRDLVSRGSVRDWLNSNAARIAQATVTQEREG